jgi:hypothetical protein
MDPIPGVVQGLVLDPAGAWAAAPMTSSGAGLVPGLQSTREEALSIKGRLTRKKSTAYHEAGHAVIGRCGGATIKADYIRSTALHSTKTSPWK